MILSTVLAASALLAGLASAAPALGSKHTVYLSTCVPNDCPIGICDPEDFNLIAAAYFENGPPTSTTARPTTFGTLSSFGTPTWEGTKRNVRLGSRGTFSSNIAAGAKSAAKSDLVGDGTLGSEPFACFKDGTTKFRVSNDGDAYTCTGEYYCPSIDVGTGSGA